MDFRNRAPAPLSSPLRSPEPGARSQEPSSSDLPPAPTLFRPRPVVVPMDLLDTWPEIEKAARDGYEELSETGLPWENVEDFLESPEVKAEGSEPLAERARRYLERLCTNGPSIPPR